MIIILFIQEVSIFYHKDVRYPKYAQMRNSKKFDILKLDSNINLDCEVLLQQLSYMQDTKHMQLQREYFKTYNDEIFGIYTKQKYIHNIRIIKNDDNSYTINYCNNCSNGYKQFKIYPNEYGRITYNERYVHCYTGIWYYGLHTYNFINCDKSKFKEKMFFRKNPDYEYSNLKYLR